mgnify:FL=1
MNREEFIQYIERNFNVSGSIVRLISNILYYVEVQGVDEDEQHDMLSFMLDGTIGLLDSEIRQICL